MRPARFRAVLLMTIVYKTDCPFFRTRCMQLSDLKPLLSTGYTELTVTQLSVISANKTCGVIFR